jgi:(p)ppGpp synthase/HD superfamily hydrolase
VAAILDGFGCSEDAVVAGFLHDTVEDAGATYDDIAASFGRQVAKLVEGASEPDKSAPWDMRKQHTIDRVKVEENADVLNLIAADKLDNVRSLRETIETRGREKTWLIFNADEEKQRWYYITLAATLLSREAENPLMRTLMDDVSTVFPPTDTSSPSQGCVSASK